MKSNREAINSQLHQVKTDNNPNKNIVQGNLKPKAIIQIPRIKMEAFIYDSIDDEVLDVGVGVMPNTGLPNGGKGTNSTLIAHRGTYQYDLFKRLDELQEGDLINIVNLESNTKLIYKMTNSMTILPNEYKKVKKEADKDKITLITCTPYLINSHRLVVTAERVDNPIVDSQSTETDLVISEPTLLDAFLVHWQTYVILFTLMGLVLIGKYTFDCFKSKKKGRE